MNMISAFSPFSVILNNYSEMAPQDRKGSGSDSVVRTEGGFEGRGRSEGGLQGVERDDRHGEGAGPLRGGS